MEQPGFKFDKTVNLGHILTFLGFMFAGFGAWTTLDKRVVVLEVAAQQQKENLGEIKRSLEKIADRLEGRPK